MHGSKLKTYFIFPYIRTIDGIKMGKFNFKALDDFKKEEKTEKEELLRIISFFRQKETALIDAFNYLIVEEVQEELNKLILDLRRSLEIFRYLSVDPEGKGLDPEHTTLYAVFPDPKNPWIFKEKEKHFMYRIHENLTGKEIFASFPHASRRPPFYKDIYGDTPPFIDDKLHQKLEEGLTEKDLRAITWYNKTFLKTAQDDKENLLHLSVAFESHFSIDEEAGREEALSEIKKILGSSIKEPALSKTLKEIKPFLTSFIIKQLSRSVKDITESETIAKWFKRHLYSVGSGIRHGDEVSELPKPVISKGKLGKSLYYAGDASHEYLNNVYFGKRLFKFLLEDTYFPYSEHVKKLAIDQLEQLLIADEERLKELEKVLSKKSIGDLTHEDVRVAFSFNQTFYGSRLRVFNILKRLLEELKVKSKVWNEISIHGDLILSTKLKEEDFMDYEKFKPFYHALIEIGSILDGKRTSTIIDDQEMKEFYIRQFVSYALHKLV